MSKGKNDLAWEKLFEKYDILHKVEENGYFNISADQIKVFREPRLMTKFDCTAGLPELFEDNKLAILPITRGDYVIAHFEAYQKFDDDNSSIIHKALPAYIQSLDVENIPSEAIALNCAEAAGIIADFMEDENIVSTVSGRMGSGEFSYSIDDKRGGTPHLIHVKNSQIEIDGAYEGVRSLALFEAKHYISEDFIVRQLYYPFCVWQKRITKPVRPIFLTYSNGIYRLYEYAFEEANNYNSLRLIKQQNYDIKNTRISEKDISDILRSVELVDEPQIPFPQANKFERVINLCELTYEHSLSNSEVTEEYEFVGRQTDYYTNAARYLGLLDKEKVDGIITYSITPEGQKIMMLDYTRKQLELCKCILRHAVFNKILRIYFESGNMPDKKETVRIMKESNLYNIGSEDTYGRRAQTVLGWIRWIVTLYTV